MLFMIEKCIRGGICQAIHQCAGCNNEYMVDYSNNKVPLYSMCYDVKNLYEWTMTQTESNKVSYEIVQIAFMAKRVPI